MGVSVSKKTVVSVLGSSLKPLGFKQKGSVWNRRVGDVIEVIDLQISKAGDAVTVNAGVLDPTVYRSTFSKEPPEFVVEPFTTVRARVGELLDRKDRWWRLDSEEAVGEILSSVTDVVLPFLQSMSGRKEMASWLARPEVMKRLSPAEILGRAIIMDLLGRHSEACELLSSGRNGAIGAWRSRYKEVAERLGCVPDCPAAPLVGRGSFD